MATSLFSNQSALQLATPSAGGDVRQQILDVANSLLPNVLLVVGVISVFFLILAGLRYIVSGGNPEKAKQARAGVIHVVIGIVIIVSTFTIIKLATGFANSLQP